VVPVRRPRFEASDVPGHFPNSERMRGSRERVRVVVGAGTVDDPVDEHRLDLAAAACAPAHANLLADELEAHESARMDVEPVRSLQLLIELRQRLLGSR
jgi:hypothetical protein